MSHLPTFNPARGKSSVAAPTRLYSSRSLPAHKALKYRQAGQGGSKEVESDGRDLETELLAAEAAHFRKNPERITQRVTQKRLTAAELNEDNDEDENDHKSREEEKVTNLTQTSAETLEEKKTRILAETRDIDASSSGSDEASEDEDEEEEEDETALLLLELERIKKERAEEEARQQREEEDKRQAERESEIAFSNPLMNPVGMAKEGFTLKRRWDEDVVFRVKEESQSKKPEFINDALRSDFHRSFMKRYVR